MFILYRVPFFARYERINCIASALRCKRVVTRFRPGMRARSSGITRRFVKCSNKTEAPGFGFETNRAPDEDEALRILQVSASSSEVPIGVLELETASKPLVA